MVRRDLDDWAVYEDKDIWQIIQDFGGQTIDQARMQREACLTKIVRNYFEHFGYEVEEQPKLGENTPDVKVKKEKYLAYIELKAYYYTTIVGEPEVAQILKYYNLALENKEILESLQSKKIFPPKFLLITSGKLVAKSENAILLSENPEALIKSKYKGYLNELGFPRDLEERDAQIIYIYSPKRFKKHKSSIIPKVLQPKRPQQLTELIEDHNVEPLILVPSEIFSKILIYAGLKREQFIFERLRKTKLERLIVDKTYLEF
ncbi:MAG: hypothetical protein ACTSU2_17000 [Promethearchaeota archaeon]